LLDLVDQHRRALHRPPVDADAQARLGYDRHMPLRVRPDDIQRAAFEQGVGHGLLEVPAVEVGGA